MSLRFERFIESLAKMVAPLGVKRGNVIVLLHEKNNSRDEENPEIEICRFRPRNIINRIKRKPRFSLKEVDDLISVLEEIRDYREKEFPRIK